MLLNPFTVMLNNNDVRPITGELVQSEIPQENIHRSFMFNFRFNLLSLIVLKILQLIKKYINVSHIIHYTHILT